MFPLGYLCFSMGAHEEAIGRRPARAMLIGARFRSLRFLFSQPSERASKGGPLLRGLLIVSAPPEPHKHRPLFGGGEKMRLGCVYGQSRGELRQKYEK